MVVSTLSIIPVCFCIVNMLFLFKHVHIVPHMLDSFVLISNYSQYIYPIDLTVYYSYSIDVFNVYIYYVIMYQKLIQDHPYLEIKLYIIVYMWYVNRQTYMWYSVMQCCVSHVYRYLITLFNIGCVTFFMIAELIYHISMSCERHLSTKFLTLPYLDGLTNKSLKFSVNLINIKIHS